MSWPPEGSAEALRRAWAAADRDERAGADPGLAAPEDPPDAERIWRAVAGELPPAEVQVLVAAAARDPAVAQAWRLAHELQVAMARDAAPGARLLPLRSLRLSPALRWAIAATLAVTLGAGLWLRLAPDAGGPGPVVRGGEPGLSIAAAVADGAALSRHDLVLRWTPLADPQARYSLRVTTADLQLVAEVADLDRAEHQLPADALRSIPAGATLLWQVDGSLPDGRVVSSPTATVRLRD
jgi:hypothetical protein